PFGSLGPLRLLRALLCRDRGGRARAHRGPGGRTPARPRVRRFSRRRRARRAAGFDPVRALVEDVRTPSCLPRRRRPLARGHGSPSSSSEEHGGFSRGGTGDGRRGMSAPVITVVIPTKNRRELLRETLAALDRQAGVPGPFEVVVADDGSTDGTPEYLESARGTFSFPLECLRLPAAGPAAARNRGIARATARRTLLLGDDTVPDPDVLASHLSGAARGEVAVQGRIEWDPASPITPFMR